MIANFRHDFQRISMNNRCAVYQCIFYSINVCFFLKKKIAWKKIRANTFGKKIKKKSISKYSKYLKLFKAFSKNTSSIFDELFV